MSYNFEFNSPVIGKVQSFKYSHVTTNEYAFTYGRDIFSNLSKFNAPIFVERKRRGIFSYDKIYIAKKAKNGFDIENTNKISLNLRNGIIVHEDNLLAKENERNEIQIFEDNLFCEKDIYANIFKEILTKEYINNLNMFTGYFIEDYKPKRITIVNIKASIKEFSLEVYDNYFLSKNINHLNIYENILSKKPIIDLNIYDNTLLQKPVNNLLVYDTVFLFKPINELTVYTNLMLSENGNNNISIYGNYFVKKPINNIVVYNNFMLSKININDLFIYKYINVSFDKEKIMNNYNIYNFLINHKSDKKNLYINNLYKILKLIPDKIYTYYDKYVLSGHLNSYKDHLKIFNSLLLSNKTRHFKEINSVKYKIQSLTDFKQKFSISKENVILNHHLDKEMSFDKYILLAYKYNHDLSFLKKDILLSMDSKRKFRINSSELHLRLLLKKELYVKINIKSLYRNRYGFVIDDSDKTLYRNINSFRINDINKFLYRDKYSFNINNTENLLIRKRYGFVINDTEDSLIRNRYGFSINNSEHFIKNINKSFNFDNFTKFIYKNKYLMSVDVSEINISKLELPLGIIVHDNTIGLIVPEKDLYKENNNQILHNNQKNTFTEYTNTFLSKEIKRTNIFNNIFVITEQRKVFLEYYHNFMLSKNTKECLLDMTNELIEKQRKDGIIYDNIIPITKHNKKAFIEKSFSINKEQKKLLKDNKLIEITKRSKDIVYYVDISLNKNAKIIDITDNIWTNKNAYITDMFKQKQTTKDIYEALVIENNVFIDKVEHQTVKDDYIDININPRNTLKHKDITVIKEDRKTNIQNYVFITKQQYETNPYVSEMNYMQKIIKDLEKPVEKTYNWAYVYQYDDPIDPNYDYYGIDELLLPEKDIDYSTFEDIIFNKKTMTPKRPIKILDDNTFIAKYPIEHPTPNYEEIGIVYIDVPTDLMYTIFTKFYQIWYANIFKFGNMSMVDSLKLMLDYMYAFIVTNYSGSEYLEPALRVFRQIRWFGETSVMHNAQYKISCEYEDLKSNLQTGNCMIKNELSRFFIDKTLKVISVEPTSIGQEAYIKLYASNKEDSQITFSISLTGGNVDVYINDLHVDTIYSNHASISYNLPATDTENEIILKRSASNNLGHCYVGNIIIKNGAYKNLSIEYDPELKAGNMPLNDIVNKMVILANMYEDEKEAFEQFRKGNLAISELYKRLEKYWEFHHENKIKGKRLTIKET